MGGGGSERGGKLDAPLVFSSKLKAGVKSSLALHNFKAEY